MVDVCLLGCGGMMPLPGRFLTSLLYRFNGRMMLVDCGEGTQVALRLAGWGIKPIDAICFTHYHADHVAGLPGLLLTIGNSGRTDPLRLYGPPGLREVAACLTVICPQLPFPVMLYELPDDAPSEFGLGGVRLSSLPGDHSAPCLSYSFSVPRQGRFDPAKAEALKIPKKYWKTLQNNRKIEENSRIFTPETVLGPPRRGIKVGYCTDTRPTAALPGFMKSCDLLICEGMYGDSGQQEKAREKGHMIFAEAAKTALESGSRELWLTHFSPALSEPEAFLQDAAGIFENTLVGHDLMQKTISFEEK